MMLSSGSASRYLWRYSAIPLVLVLIVLSIYTAMAAPPGNDAFQNTWQRTDKPVVDGATARTWMWGPEANSDVIEEPYQESPNGIREVQYFDKARMEITQPGGDAASIWYVTNGLLVVELMTGDMQIGNAAFEDRNPATVNVAGDADDPTGITYAVLAAFMESDPWDDGTLYDGRIHPDGSITTDPALEDYGVDSAVIDDVTNHSIARPFWDFMNSSGTIYQNGQFIDSQLFENPYFATGRPITEAYWANVKVAGTYRDVLMQCFERRCLTYTPGNPDGFVVEAGNVGQHYYAWRYGQQPGNPTPTTTVTATASASETVTVSPTTTATSTATTTMTASPTTSPTASPTATTTETVVPEYEYASQWGTQYSTFTAMKAPVDVAIDGAGNLWVVDTHNHRLIEYDENGVFMRTLGSEGTGPGQFKFPVDATFSDDGRLYVADQGNNRIQVFSAEGTFLKEWGALGTANGQFNAPSGVLVQGQALYVVDLNNGRIQTFNLEGTYLGQFGAGILDHPAQLAIAPSGMMYITDFQTHVIREYNPSTVSWTYFGGEGTGPRQFKNPAGIAIDADGYIYVSESGNHRVQVLNPNTSYNSEWGTKGYGFGQFFGPRDLVLDGKGNLYVADYGNNRIQKFTTDGNFLYEVRDASRGQFGNVSDIALDQNGNLLTVDRNKVSYDSGSITRFTPDGIPLDALSLSRPERGQYDQLVGLAVNLTSGDIYVTDSYSNRVQHFTSTWQYLGKWGMAGTGPGEFNNPTAIATDADGNVYVTDSLNNRVQKFDANGVFLDQWGGVGSGDGQFQQPSGITVDGERVYVSDYGNNRVEVFDRNGTYLDQWGSLGSGLGELNGPVGLATTPQGLVLVVDYGNNRVQIFSPEGEALNSFGLLGSGPGQFNVPWGIEVDEDGNAYVTDVGNYRVQKFSPVN